MSIVVFEVPDERGCEVAESMRCWAVARRGLTLAGSIGATRREAIRKCVKSDPRGRTWEELTEDGYYTVPVPVAVLGPSELAASE